MQTSRRAALLGLAALAAGCKRRAPETLLVFAAASTSEAMGELGKLYESKHGERIRFSWGGSGDLARQIEAGAPADVFLSADVARVEKLEKAGYVARRQDLLRNRLVVMVPSASTVSIASAADLRAIKRLAIGDPASVPAGAYAKGWLEREGVWGDVASKVVPTLDVRAALAAVENGAVDAAIVYRTDARVAKSARIAFEPKEQPVIVYPIAVLTRARRPAADALVDLAASPEGRAIFEKHGFSTA